MLNRKNIVSILLLLTLFLFVIYFFFFLGWLKLNINQKNDVQNITESTQENKNCKEVIEAREKDLCLKDEALKAVDFNVCLDIEDLMIKKGCVKQLIDAGNNQDCLILTDNELITYCESENYYKQAIETRDVAICKKITRGIQRANCLSSLLDILPSSDIDNDGLSFVMENIYGTNPDSADTDNDGYTDSSEISNGYNPVGEGSFTSKEAVNCSDMIHEELTRLCEKYFPFGQMDLKNCAIIDSTGLKAYCNYLAEKNNIKN